MSDRINMNTGRGKPCFVSDSGRAKRPDLLELPRTKQEAIQQGVKFYWTGVPCVDNHMDKRHISRGCHSCQLKAQYKWRQGKGKNSFSKSVSGYQQRNLGYFITRGVLKRLLKRKTTGLKVHQVDELLGYSASQLRERLESQFKEGMSWDNWGEWHIDHIKPVAQFKREGITDPKIINALSNLQPLWAEENLKKSDKTLDEDF